ncbi:MAG: Crp/Fnr family transcriptional regulator [Gammaproteobacteria bacterium]|nr:Crp/Fnr family transcriptional regulator [Gammaproteobacteria bacterium]
MSDTSSETEWGSLFPYLSQPASDSDARITRAMREISLPADTVAFRQGDNCANYLLVIEGSIKVLARSESGREIVLYRVPRGGSCVLTTSCLLSHSHYPAEGITETPVRALAIPADTFHQGLAESGEFRQFVFNAYGQRLAEVIALVEEISFGQINRRLARYLLQHVSGNDLMITHQGLATELGSAREVISRHLKDFEQRGWIEQQRGRIRLIEPESLLKLIQNTV